MTRCCCRCAVQGTQERLVVHQQSPAHFLISNIFNDIRLVRRREEPRSKFTKAREIEDACKYLLEQLHWVFVSKPLSKSLNQSYKLSAASGSGPTSATASSDDDAAAAALFAAALALNSGVRGESGL
jgi:hypothetical protein